QDDPIRRGDIEIEADQPPQVLDEGPRAPIEIPVTYAIHLHAVQKVLTLRYQSGDGEECPGTKTQSHFDCFERRHGKQPRPETAAPINIYRKQRQDGDGDVRLLDERDRMRRLRGMSGI